MTLFEFARFVLDNEVQIDGADLLATTVVGIDLLATKALFPPKMVYKFSPSFPRILKDSFSTCSKSTSNGDKCPTI